VEGSFGSLHVWGLRARGAGRQRDWAAVVIGPLLILAGILAGLGAVLLLRGSGWRVGRLLAVAPRRTLEEAAEIAARGVEVYVRVHGRIDSDEEFPDSDGQPLVYRRRRLQRRAGRGRWQTFDDQREAVPFGLREQGQRLTIEAGSLGDGLVVVPRESEGVAADLTEATVGGPLPEMAPDVPVRLRIERISAVDHATAAGVPRLGPDGSVMLGPGLGRPLLLTTLEQDEAMRVLAEGRPRRLRVALVLLVACPLAVGLGLLVLVAGW
jgi:hypothetical protein